MKSKQLGIATRNSSLILCHSFKIAQMVTSAFGLVPRRAPENTSLHHHPESIGLLLVIMGWLLKVKRLDW